ncbi:MAG: elongation factor P-like protein YeiP [Gammaproteobacteria bacterium]|nr:elongation factor P-like protein YeiP [Gammaproteobacteria bacterium]
MKASEIKKGLVIEADGANVVVTEVQVQTASSRSGNTLYKVRGRNVVTRQKFQAAFKGDEFVQTVEFERRAVQFLYEDADGCTFMDRDTYEQYAFSIDAIEDERPYLTDGLEGVYVLVVDGMPVGIELPATVVQTIVECAPAMKGASAAARNKPATTHTGLVVLVPEYLASGESIKINTLTGDFMSRA